jgi:mRNA-degrading endonuclease RelE of RelBE toxin-antitoxin system
MLRRQPFKLIYAPGVKDHLKAIEPKYYSLIRGTIEKQLRLEPDVETRNRKPLKRSVEFESPWEIRFGPNNRFRVFYEVNRESRQVHILAIGEKKGSQLFISGEEFEL